ncbi:hypothetical protein HYFRA_00000117 [Hymenoscyphus fraxineus]|uniref:Uncharacterized protein n=1 Tax=Hymenoscyphus fraxineus TaxID=746836 RepID=A0A9N9L1K0_9HELO|nr:hypothetical protein HYFRA_00000117 [Hymenoscyphus fraxineus]
MQLETGGPSLASSPTILLGLLKPPLPPSLAQQFILPETTTTTTTITTIPIDAAAHTSCALPSQLSTKRPWRARKERVHTQFRSGTAVLISLRPPGRSRGIDNTDSLLKAAERPPPQAATILFLSSRPNARRLA